MTSQGFVEPLAERSLNRFAPVSQVLPIDLLGVCVMARQRETQRLSGPCGRGRGFRCVVGGEHFRAQSLGLAKSLLLEESRNQLLPRDVVLQAGARKIQQHRPPRIVGVGSVSDIQLLRDCRFTFDVREFSAARIEPGR